MENYAIYLSSLKYIVIVIQLFGWNIHGTYSLQAFSIIETDLLIVDYFHHVMILSESR